VSEQELADAHTRHLAAQSDSPTDWFERLYAEAEQGEAIVPWDRGEPHGLLAEWTAARDLAGAGRRALVVGCGLGRDSEFIAGLGFDTVAFDVSETAIQTTRKRFPDTKVEYVAADLLNPPAEWLGAFHLVVESMTVQALPASIRPQAIAAVGPFVAPGGMLLVIAAGRAEDSPPAEGPPWPLTRTEIDAFATANLQPVKVEDRGGRWRAEFAG
jgi:SAM-dependent methyltransferase